MWPLFFIFSQEMPQNLTVGIGLLLVETLWVLGLGVWDGS